MNSIRMGCHMHADVVVATLENQKKVHEASLMHSTDAIYGLGQQYISIACLDGLRAQRILEQSPCAGHLGFVE